MQFLILVSCLVVCLVVLAVSAADDSDEEQNGRGGRNNNRRGSPRRNGGGGGGGGFGGGGRRGGGGGGRRNGGGRDDNRNGGGRDENRNGGGGRRGGRSRSDENIPDDDDPNTIESEWQKFKGRHNSNKLRGRKSDQERKQRFERNRNQVRDHNKQFDSGAVKYTTRLNAFSDLDPEEVKTTMMGLKKPAEAENNNVVRSSQIPIRRNHPNRLKRQTAPDSIDYRDHGYVTPVKQQGQCGCCWTFAAAAALEGQQFAATGRLTELSKQNLIDCAASNYGNYGCNGGWPMNAYNYVKDNGIQEETSYPFVGTDNQGCRFNPGAKSGLIAHGGAYLPEGDEQALKEAIYNIGPVAVAINADSWGFQQYSSGVYTDNSCSKDVDHAVTIVGYGEENGTPYWLVKNSWGTDWGDDGYIKFARNNNNQCGIASWAQYPLVEGALDEDPNGNSPNIGPGPNPNPSPTQAPGPGPNPFPNFPFKLPDGFDPANLPPMPSGGFNFDWLRQIQALFNQFLNRGR